MARWNMNIYIYIYVGEPKSCSGQGVVQYIWLDTSIQRPYAAEQVFERKGIGGIGSSCAREEQSRLLVF